MAFGDETKAYIDRKRAGLHLLAINIGKTLETEAKANASWTDRTGNTRRAIHGGGDKTEKGATAYLAHGSMVGTYLEEGTGIYGPHRTSIVPVRAQAMRFTMGGKVVFAKQTKGMPAQPIIRPTADKKWPEIQRVVRKYWEGT